MRGYKGYADFLNFEKKYFLKVARLRELRGLRRARLLCHFQRYPKGCEVAKVTMISENLFDNVCKSRAFLQCGSSGDSSMFHWNPVSFHKIYIWSKFENADGNERSWSTWMAYHNTCIYNFLLEGLPFFFSKHFSPNWRISWCEMLL